MCVYVGVLSLANTKLEQLVSGVRCWGAKYQWGHKSGLDTGESRGSASWLLEVPGVQASYRRDYGVWVLATGKVICLDQLLGKTCAHVSVPKVTGTWEIQGSYWAD